MKTWPAKYRLLAVAAIFYIVATSLVYLYLLRPRRMEVAGRLDEMERITNDIRGKGWAVDPDQLQRLLRQKRDRLNTLQAQMTEIQKRAASTFAERITNKYGPDAIEDTDKFIHYASSLDYQTYYEQIIGHWRGNRVPLEPEVLNLTDDSSADYIYQSVLQLWSLDKILGTATRNGLMPVVKNIRLPKSDQPGITEAMPTSAYRTVRAATVSLLPVREYYINQDAETGFLLEMPVRLTVRGTIEQLSSFLQNLDQNDSLISLNSVEIYKLPPSRPGQRIELLEIKMECGTFYPLRLEDTIELRQPVKTLPAGA